MTDLKVKREQARRFLVHYHSLNDYSELSGRQGVVDYIKRVGCIQYDPLDVVGRNPDLILRARVSAYRPELLHSLLYEDRLLIDGWDKMMSIYHVEDWPRMAEVRKEAEESIPRVLEHRKSLAALDSLDEVRDELRLRGPLRPGQIKLGAVAPGRWGHRNVAGAAMDFMYRRGELSIERKRNTQKVYDFTRNLLPAQITDERNFLSREEFLPWYCLRRIGSVGLLWDKNSPAWFGTHIGDENLRRTTLKRLLDQGSICGVEIAGVSEKFYVRSQDIEALTTSNRSPTPTVRIIAPLDNLIWDRAMTKAIFGFEYSWEVYLPKRRRKYGYYVLPVLFGDVFVARVEFDKSRDNGTLNVLNWWWEDDVSRTARLMAEIAKELRRFARYLGLDGLRPDVLIRLAQDC